MDVTETVLNFRAFLNAGYDAWLRSAQVTLTRDRGFLDESFYDWAQANWELLVERSICPTDEYLNIYGAGSDYEMQLHSRVFFRDAKPTHEIACESADDITVIDLLSGKEFNPTSCSFDRFVTRKDSWYQDEPQFDCVLLDSGSSQFMATATAVKFVLQPIAPRPNSGVV